MSSESENEDAPDIEVVELSSNVEDLVSDVRKLSSQVEKLIDRVDDLSSGVEDLVCDTEESSSEGEDTNLDASDRTTDVELASDDKKPSTSFEDPSADAKNLPNSLKDPSVDDKMPSSSFEGSSADLEKPTTSSLEYPTADNEKQFIDGEDQSAYLKETSIDDEDDSATDINEPSKYSKEQEKQSEDTASTYAANPLNDAKDPRTSFVYRLSDVQYDPMMAPTSDYDASTDTQKGSITEGGGIRSSMRREGLEKTLALIKPTFTSRTKHIEALIVREGMAVLRKKRVLLRRDQATRFHRIVSRTEYDERQFEVMGDRRRSKTATSKEENDALKSVVDALTSGPVDALILSGSDCASRWQDLIGQDDDLLDYDVLPVGLEAVLGRGARNGVYGSPDAAQAKKEIRFFFPDTRFESDLGLGASGEYLARTVNEVLIKGLVELCLTKPEEPVLWLAHWLLENRPNEPI